MVSSSSGCCASSGSGRRTPSAAVRSTGPELGESLAAHEEIERQKREAERLQQLEEEKKAHAEWERYHRYRRIEEVDQMTWLQFEAFVITLYQKAGYLNVTGTPINDQGADICVSLAETARRS